MGSWHVDWMEQMWSQGEKECVQECVWRIPVILTVLVVCSATLSLQRKKNKVWSGISDGPRKGFQGTRYKAVCFLSPATCGQCLSRKGEENIPGNWKPPLLPHARFHHTHKQQSGVWRPASQEETETIVSYGLPHNGPHQSLALPPGITLHELLREQKAHRCASSLTFQALSACSRQMEVLGCSAHFHYTLRSLSDMHLWNRPKNEETST